MWSRRFLNRFVIRPVALALLRPEFVGLENIPADGPFILMVNHCNWLDPVVAGLAMYPREVMFFVKVENTRDPLLGLFFRAYGAVPVERGEADVRAIRRAVEVLTVERDILYVSPEGTRSRHGRLLPAKNGMAFIAVRTGVPILPVGVTGVKPFRSNLRRLRRTPVWARIGHPFRLRAHSRVRGQALSEMTREAMYQLAALLPPEQWGAYADIENATEKYFEFLDPGRSNLVYASRPHPSLPYACPRRFAGALE